MAYLLLSAKLPLTNKQLKIIKPKNKPKPIFQTNKSIPPELTVITIFLITIIRHIIMRFFGIFVTFVIPRKKIYFFRLKFAYLLQIITGFLFILIVNSTQQDLFAQNNPLNELNESGAVVLKRSIDTISRFIRVECNMRISTFVDGSEFAADGKYEEQAVNSVGLEENKNREIAGAIAPKNQLSEFQRTMFRQELNFTVDKLQTEPDRIILVCYPDKNDSKNGNIWQFRSINGIKTLNQINIDVVEAAIKRSRNINNGVVGADSRMFTQVGMLCNVGGIAGVLGQIDRFYEFGELPKVETINNAKTLKLAGTMRRAYLDILLKKHGASDTDKNNRYPSNLPCDIEVYIGINDSFPHKIRYLNRKTEKAKPNNLLSEINYNNIIINGDPIPEHHFSTFQNEVPAGVSKIDSSTEQYIKSLGL